VPKKQERIHAAQKALRHRHPVKVNPIILLARLEQKISLQKRTASTSKKI
jgi:hypothetical protein